jgi:hypothetical protein
MIQILKNTSDTENFILCRLYVVGVNRKINYNGLKYIFV